MEANTSQTVTEADQDEMTPEEAEAFDREVDALATDSPPSEIYLQGFDLLTQIHRENAPAWNAARAVERALFRGEDTKYIPDQGKDLRTLHLANLAANTVPSGEQASIVPDKEETEFISYDS